MNASDLVLYEREGRLAYITLNRPAVLNAFSDDSIRALKDRLYEFDRDEEAWVAILHGNGRAFSAGADVRQRQLRPTEELRALGGPSGRGATHHHILYEDHVNWKPVVAATHGYVMGMALGLALRCELVVAEEETVFEATETRRGTFAGQFWSVMQFRGAGTFADEVFMTGRRFTGAEAFRHGLVNRAVPAGCHLDGARELAEAILRHPPLGIRAMVRARRWYLRQLEQDHTLIYEGAKLHLTEDFRESARAFAEKREPGPYKGR